MAEDKGLRSLFERLQRIETRMVAGFEALGIVITSPEEWCTVDNVAHTVELRGPSRSLKSIQLAIAEAGGDDSTYDVLIGGELVATIVGGSSAY